MQRIYGGKRVTVTQETTFTGFQGFMQAIDMADVVILATPPGFRPEHFEYAVARNKHIFMEKPVATDAYGVRRVLASGYVPGRRGRRRWSTRCASARTTEKSLIITV